MGRVTQQQLAAIVRGIVPVLREYVTKSQADVTTRLTMAESRLELKAAETSPVLSALADLAKEHAALRERLAVLETRPQLPGPPGPSGQDGKDGAPGTAGLEWAGIYKDDRTYYRGQLAKWGGSVYVALKETTGVKPDALPQRTIGPNGTVEYDGVCGKDFWDLFVQKGDKGKDGKP